MTFKHMKFEDSPTMRALEKVAKEKGLVKPETLEKKASIAKKADYTPTPNLMENIFKLCAGLRTQGLVKEAAEIETNYLNYKQAQTLYETSTEKGDDLVDAAHPKGSHKLEGVAGEEAVVETIIDQHLKHLEMVNKKPTGKLSSASVLNAVKKVLGQAQPQTRDWTGPEMAQDWSQFPDKWKKYVTNYLVETAYGAYQRAAAGMSKIQIAMKQGKEEQTDAEHTTWVGYEHTNWLGDLGRTIQKANNVVQEMRTSKEITVPKLNAMIEAFEDAKTTVYMNSNNEEVRTAATNDFQGAIQATNDLKAPTQAWVSDQSRLPAGVPAPKMPVSQAPDFKNQVNAISQRYDLYVNMHFENRVPPASKAKITNFLAGVGSNVAILKSYMEKKDTDIASIKADLDKLIADVTGKLNYFKTAIIDKAPAQ